ncbi:MAG: CDP-2,3-bis-(O-geranylgeranyl)-sn-glycerol synthase [Candidatus Aenigmarchaeota archaeon]|nr:CDP-2,3-bis-(O-geranylgeranyl)-sn-glycerol synthase [Candidatus Aenigmarchaeota archaeon]
MISFLLQSLWFILPAYIANSSPVISKGKHPLDFHAFLGKNRLLGDGKTIEGSATGIAFGTLAGTLQILLQPYAPDNFVTMTAELAFLLAFGAIAGDIVGAFIKRRLGIARGASAPLLDQLDFLIVSLTLSTLVVSMPYEVYIVLFLITPVVHLSANIISHFLKLKEVPW